MAYVLANGSFQYEMYLTQQMGGRKIRGRMKTISKLKMWMFVKDSECPQNKVKNEIVKKRAKEM